MAWNLGLLGAAGAGVAGAYDLLETTVLTSSASSVTFSGLGSYSDYKHLQIRAVTRNNTSNSSGMEVNFNSDTGANYVRHYLIGDGSAVQSSGNTGRTYIDAGNVAGVNSNVFSSHIIDILDFSNTTKNTTTRTMSGINDSLTRIWFLSGLWLNTSAVTSISMTVSGNAVAGSRFSLYGIKGA